MLANTERLQSLSKVATRVDASDSWIPRLVGLAALMLVAAPLITVAVAAFRPGMTLPFQAGEWTVGNFTEAFGDPFVYRLLLNTFLYTFLSLAISLPIALGFAWLVERTDLPYRNSIYTLLLIPMAVPSLLKALGWVMLLGPRQGVINLLLRDALGLQHVEGPLNIYSFAGMVFLTVLSVMPSMFLLLGPLLRTMNPLFEEASETAGATMFDTLRKIVLPLISPGVLAVILYYVIVMIEYFEIPLAIGLNARFPVLSLQIYALTRSEQLPQYGLASTYSFLGLGLGCFLLYRYRKLTAGAQRYEVITGKGYTQRKIKLGWGRYLALAFIGLYLVLAVVLPVIILLWASLMDYYVTPTWDALSRASFKNYFQVLRNPRILTAAYNTVILFLTVATCTTLLALLVSWVIHRFRPPFGWLIDAMVFLPLAVPSIVIALGVLLFYIRTPLWGTIWVIALGHLIRFLPFTVRSISAAILQIHQELEEASSVSGASRFATLRTVTFPLLLPALGNSWLWVAVHSMRDFSFPLMLVSYQNIVITSLLWSLWEEANLTGLSALAIILIIASIAFTVTSRRIASQGTHY